MFDFTDQVVLVTGGSGNLGAAVARAFLAAGARLVLAERNVEHLRGQFPELAETNDHYLAAPVDLAQAEDVAHMVETALARFGQIDVLVNTVGGYRAGTPPHETSLDTWDFMLNLNARTAFNTGRAVIPSMLERGRGKIVNTAARSALAAGPNEVAYSVSKSAVARITESFAAAYKKSGINVNAILPGTIDTPQNRAAMPNADTSRWLQPETLAQVYLFLTSEAASPIHGALIPVYGLT